MPSSAFSSSVSSTSTSHLPDLMMKQKSASSPCFTTSSSGASFFFSNQKYRRATDCSDHIVKNGVLLSSATVSSMSFLTRVRSSLCVELLRDEHDRRARRVVHPRIVAVQL